MMTGSPGFLLESHPFKISPRSRVPSLGSPATSVHFPSETPCCQAADPLGTATITDLSWEPLWPVGRANDFPLATPSQVPSGPSHWFLAERFISNLTLPEFSCRGGTCMGIKQLVRTYSWDSCWLQPAPRGRTQLPSHDGSPPQGSLSPPSPYQGDCWL